MIFASVVSMVLELSSWLRSIPFKITSEHLEISSAASEPKETMLSRLYTSILLASSSTSGEPVRVWSICWRSATMLYWG